MAPASTPPASPAVKPKKRGLFGLPRLGYTAVATSTPATSDNSSVKMAMRHLIEERDELRELLRVGGEKGKGLGAAERRSHASKLLRTSPNPQKKD
jgi:hypothetical protein